MLSNKGFDLWADGYDKAVGLSDESNTYPFAGYKAVLGGIFSAIMASDRNNVLDIGFGTGTLASKLYEHGCDIYGQDFSAKMIEIASAKMPGAHLYQGDFSKCLVNELAEKRYDFIVSTYALHHLTLDQKIAFISQLHNLLNEGGMLLIGDVAFGTSAELNACRNECGDEWDDEEIYFVYDEMKEVFPEMTFEKVSYCAGILTLKK